MTFFRVKSFLFEKKIVSLPAQRSKRENNMFVEPACESPLIVSDRAVYLAKNS